MGGWVGGSRTTYPNSLIDQLTGLLQLLRGAPDGEDAYVGVSVGRRVPLELHMGTRLLFDVLDGFSTCKTIRFFFKKKEKKTVWQRRTLWSAVKSKNQRSEWGSVSPPAHLPPSPEVVLLPYKNPGMRLTTYLPFCANIHANQ